MRQRQYQPPPLAAPLTHLQHTLHFGYKHSTNLLSDPRLVQRGLLRDGAPPAPSGSLLRWTQVVICAWMHLHVVSLISGMPDCLVFAVASAEKYLRLVGTWSRRENSFQPLVCACVRACVLSDPVACMFPGILQNFLGHQWKECLSVCLSGSYSCNTLICLIVFKSVFWILRLSRFFLLV